MKTLRVFTRARPLLMFFLLAYGLTWAAVFAIVGIEGLKRGELSTSRALVVWLAMILGPSLAALAMTGAVDGRAGFRQLGARLVRWRVGARWYATLLVAPVAGALVVTGLALYSRDFAPMIVTEPDPAVLMPLFVAITFGAAMEELGWTGFATPRLRMMYGFMASTLMLGTIHGAWHLLAGVSGRGDAGATYIPTFIVFWIVGLIALRALIIWAFDKTESLLLAQMIHASYSAPLLLLTPQSAAAAQMLLLWTLFTVVFGSFAVVLVFGGRLRIAEKGIVHPPRAPAA